MNELIKIETNENGDARVSGRDAVITVMMKVFER